MESGLIEFKAPYHLQFTSIYIRGRLCTEKIARTRKLPLRPGDVCWAIQKGRMYPALVLQLNVAEKDGDTAMRSGTWSVT